MGQLNPNGAIFLSAGVPDPTAPHFVADADTAAISAAVSALLYVILGRRRLVWGGHPAITPMVWAFAESMDLDYGAWVRLYQTDFFKDEFPEETALFKNVVVTQKVERDLGGSLAVMREQMLSETDFGAAVFIGGMKGVFDEFALFKAHAPSAAVVPIMSTGGAAEHLGKEIQADPIFAEELDYVDLLHRVLEIDPNETRYRSPDDQPADVGSRLSAPGGMPS
jgi:hypothetical protein